MTPSEQTEKILVQNFPEIGKQFNKIEDKNKILYCMSCFATFTELHIQYGNFDVVKKCFEIANQLITDGDADLKKAVEKFYLTKLNLEGIAHNQLIGYFPGELKSFYRSNVKSAA